MKAWLLVGLLAVDVIAACGPSSSSPAPSADAAPPPTGLSAGDGGVSGTVDPFDPVAPLANRVGSYFTSCSGGPEDHCHGIGEAHLTLSFGDGGDVIDVASFERPELVRVKPFDPEASYLYLKVLGDGGIDGGRMPLLGTFDERAPVLIHDWIEAGAPTPIE